MPTTLFFFNPNIAPKEEYELRKNELKRYAQTLGIDFIEGDTNHELWLNAVKGLENEPERGARCLECFKFRLRATAQLADTKGFTQIATTLTSSRWKSLEQLEQAGRWAVEPFSNVSFWAKNGRKDGLSERRRILLLETKFYNQTYCGCEFSKKTTFVEKNS